MSHGPPKNVTVASERSLGTNDGLPLELAVVVLVGATLALHALSLALEHHELGLCVAGCAERRLLGVSAALLLDLSWVPTKAAEARSPQQQHHRSCGARRRFLQAAPLQMGWTTTSTSSPP